MVQIYTARAHSVGGRSGLVRTQDGGLTFKLTGDNSSGRTGTNPEELFACGYASCFGTAVDVAAQQMGLGLIPITVNSAVDFRQESPERATISVTMDILLPNLDQAMAEKVVQRAHEICPYSKATSGNISVTLRTNEQIIPNEDFPPVQSFVARQ